MIISWFLFCAVIAIVGLVANIKNINLGWDFGTFLMMVTILAVSGFYGL